MANLITLEEYKTYTGIRSTEQDDRINSIIPQVSTLIKTYCGRRFNDAFEEAFEEYLDSTEQYLYTKEFPLISIDSFEVSSDNGTTYTVLTEGTDYIIDRVRDRIYFPNYTSYSSSLNAIRLKYIAGYEVLPNDLKLAVMDTVQYYLKSENNPKKTVGFVSVEYITSSDFPHHIKRVLDLYRVL